MISISPRGDYIVLELLTLPEVVGGMDFSAGKKQNERFLGTYKVIKADTDVDTDITEGSKVLCRPDDVQTFDYKGEKRYLIQKEYIMGFLNV